MQKPRRSQAFRRLAQALRDPQPPISPEQLAHVWATKNHDPLVEVALRALREPAGRQYCIEPLHFIVFESEANRQAYWERLLLKAKCRDPKYSRDERLCLHVEALTEWCRGEVARALRELVIRRVYPNHAGGL